MPSFLERRQAILDRHTVLESVPESTWHPDNAASPRKKGEPDLTTRPLCFIGNKAGFFVGPCAHSALARLKSFAEREAPRLDEDTDDQTRRALEVAREAALVIGSEGEERLSFHRNDLNDAIWAIMQTGMLVCSTGEKA